jgi:hypothetical protein
VGHGARNRQLCGAAGGKDVLPRVRITKVYGRRNARGPRWCRNAQNRRHDHKQFLHQSPPQTQLTPLLQANLYAVDITAIGSVGGCILPPCNLQIGDAQAFIDPSFMIDPLTPLGVYSLEFSAGNPGVLHRPRCPNLPR